MHHQYRRNVLALVSGAALAQFLPVAVSPLLTRLFEPSDFGLYAIYAAVTAICGVVAAGRYDMALMKPAKDEEEDAAGLWALANVSGLTFAALAAFVLIALWFAMPTAWLLGRLGIALYAVPVAIAAISVFNTCMYWLNRHQRYGTLSKLRASQGALIACATVLAGLLDGGGMGMILAASASQLIAALLAVFTCRDALVQAGKSRKWWELASRYRRYPLVSTPTGLLNSVSLQAPTLFFSHQFAETITGHFNLAFRVLASPSSVLASSIGQIYFQRVSALAARETDCAGETWRTAIRLFGLACLIFSPVALAGGPLFAFIFGSEWHTAGGYAQIMVISVAVKFVVSPLSTVFLALDRQSTLAKWQISYFVTCLTTLAVFIGHGPVALLWALVAHDLVMYGVHLLLIRLVLRRGAVKGEKCDARPDPVSQQSG